MGKHLLKQLIINITARSHSIPRKKKVMMVMVEEEVAIGVDCTATGQVHI